MRTLARLATAACAAGALVLGLAVTPAAAGPVPTTRTSWTWATAVGLASDGRTLSSFPSARRCSPPGWERSPVCPAING